MPHATRPGDVLGERYRLVDLLAESDGGRFWRAHDRVLERHVAIHVIRGDDARAPALMRAAQRSATVLDPRVLRVLDAECTDEECYVVNEWGWGASLDVVVAGSGPLSPRRAAWLVAEVADSVAVAHAAGVAHGRLNPENVLVDRAGGIRIIGLCVDAALHGIDAGEPAALGRDVDDLAALLYCALTARWAGPSGSAVPSAPRAGGAVLRPRQVRAGIPRSLDLLCDDLVQPDGAGRHREPGAERTARDVADYLADFVGDPTGMPEALLDSTPDVLPDEEQVVLPPVPELLPHDVRPAEPDQRPEPPVRREPEDAGAGVTGVAGGAEADVPEDEPRDVPEGPEGPEDDITTGDLARRPAVEDLPTEAGVPIFGDDDDVSWLERRSTPAPPPPPFEAPPERPLFAPGPARAPRAPERGDRTDGRGDDGFWPWDTGAGPAGPPPPPRPGPRDRRSDDDSVPGRTFLRLGVALAAVVVLVVAVLVAVRVGGGDDGAESGPSSPPTSATATGPTGDATPRAPRVAVLRGVGATAYDPEGDDGEENDDTAVNVVDGDPETTWSTSGYNDQLGPPPGLKLGVGLLLDLGATTTVDEVTLTTVGLPTAVSLYVVDEVPDSVDGLDPVAEDVAQSQTLVLDAEGATGRYLVVYLTALPRNTDGRYRGEVAEVVVRGSTA